MAAPSALSLEVPPLHKRKRIPMRVIRALVKHIADCFDPDEIILFGSHAYGTAQPWSDVDLLVIKNIPKGQETQARRAIRESLPRHSFSIDILVRSREVVERRKALGDWFLREITSKGKVMYQRRDGRKSQPNHALADANELPRSQLGESSATHKLKESSTMNELAEEWLVIAEADLKTAQLVLNAEGGPITRTACFHSQQCAEKYLKAYLTERQIEFPRRHPLVPLMELCLRQDRDFEVLRNDLEQLEGYAVDVRYPGGDVTPEQAKVAIEAALRVRAFVRGKLGLE